MKENKYEEWETYDLNHNNNISNANAEKTFSWCLLFLLKPYIFSFMLTELEQIIWNYQEEKVSFPLANSFYWMSSNPGYLFTGFLILGVPENQCFPSLLTWFPFWFVLFPSPSWLQSSPTFLIIYKKLDSARVLS